MYTLMEYRWLESIDWFLQIQPCVIQIYAQYVNDANFICEYVNENDVYFSWMGIHYIVECDNICVL